jgi:hypothetical protein
MHSLGALTSSGLRKILPRGVQLPQRLGMTRRSNGGDGFLNVGIAESMGLATGIDAVEFVELGSEDTFQDYFGAFALTMGEGFGRGEVGVANFLEKVDRRDLGGDGFEPVAGIHKYVRIRIFRILGFAGFCLRRLVWLIFSILGNVGR